MTLPNDITRCRGAWKHGMCSRRCECARYVYSETSTQQTLHSVSMCPGLDDYWQFFIPVTEKTE